MKDYICPSLFTTILSPLAKVSSVPQLLWRRSRHLVLSNWLLYHTNTKKNTNNENMSNVNQITEGSRGNLVHIGKLGDTYSFRIYSSGSTMHSDGIDDRFVINHDQQTVQFVQGVARADHVVEELGWTKYIVLLRSICNLTPAPANGPTSPSQALKEWVTDVLSTLAALPDVDWLANDGTPV
jgi:hypothetical protein